MAKREQQVKGLQLPGDPNVITYAHYGDWIAVWHNNKQIHFHDENFSNVLHKIGDAVGFKVEQLDLGPLDDVDDESQGSLDGDLDEVKDNIAKAKASVVKEEVNELRSKLREKELELNRLRGDA